MEPADSGLFPRKRVGFWGFFFCLWCVCGDTRLSGQARQTSACTSGARARLWRVPDPKDRDNQAGRAGRGTFSGGTRMSPPTGGKQEGWSSRGDQPGFISRHPRFPRQVRPGKASRARHRDTGKPQGWDRTGGTGIGQRAVGWDQDGTRRGWVGTAAGRDHSGTRMRRDRDGTGQG